MTTFVDSGKARLACESSGTGRDVLMIHAGVTDRRSWAPLRGALTDSRCICYDARGFGETGYESEDGWSAVDDAIAVLDAHAVDRAVVIGGSIGGGTSIDLALAHPERVAALVLIGSAVNGSPGPGALDEATRSLDEAGDAALAAGDLEELNRIEAQLWLDGPGHPGRVTGRPRELFLEMNAIALAAAEAGEQREPTPAWDRLDRIAVPTLVLVGEYDLAHIRANAAHLADSIPNARHLDLAGVAHLPQVEGDPTTLRAVAEFVPAR